jgi:hypothetical protein
MIDANQNAAIRALVQAVGWSRGEPIVQAMMDAEEKSAIRAVGQVL